MKPLSYIYSYINIPEKDWNNTEIDIWLFNAMKNIGISAMVQNTKLVSIVNHRACICEDYEYIKAVVIRKDYSKPKQITDYQTDDEGNILIPNGEYPIVQQTVNDQVHAIYPLLPTWFPKNKPEALDLWFWAEPTNMTFEKVCTECPTYCNNCDYTYSLDMKKCLYFPQIETGVACICYNKLPHSDEFLIDETNQFLMEALKNYVMANYWEVKMNIDFTQQSKSLYELYYGRWTDNKKNARGKSLLDAFSIKTVRHIMTPTNYK